MPGSFLTCEDDPEQCLVSMDIFILSKKLLSEVLDGNDKIGSSNLDFGKDILPTLVESRQVHAYYYFGETQGQACRPLLARH